MAEPAAAEEPARAEPRPFNQWLLEQRDGALHAELTDALAAAAAAAVEHEKPASLTLKITLKPQKKYAGDVLEVADDVVAKVPKPNRGAALFYADEAGGLSRNNPNQPQLPLREVPRRNKEAASA